MKPVKWGILSTARIALSRMVPALQRSPHNRVIAIASRDPRKARAAADQLGVPRAYGSYDELLADAEVEALYVGLPNNMHVEWTIRAAEAGKHVLCDKPIALDAADAARLIGARDRAGVEITEAFMVRYHTRWLRARELVRSGRLGALRSILASFTVWNDDPADIRNQRATGGGALYDVGCYPVAAARFFFEAEPSRAFARFELDPRFGVDHTVSGLVEFPAGRHLVFTASLQLAWGQWIRLAGTEGWIDLPVAFLPEPLTATCIRIFGRFDIGETAVVTETVEAVDQYELEGATFARVVRGELPQPWPIENAVAQMRVLDALRRSAASGRPEAV
jgi:D-xylose 1-dehydrogenase (NADP+, D-xylono-1,5-lactone-forming)